MDKKEKAKKMYEEGCKYKDISEQLSVPLNTLKSWKKRYEWERGGATKKVQPSSRGAPIGNKNAVGASGNKKASPPEGNKNAVTTGEYESLYNNYLDDDEKSLLQTEVDSFSVLQKEINLLRVRQARMLKRITEAENKLTENEQQLLYELRGRKKIIETKGKKVSVNEPELVMTEKREKKTPKIDLILRIEDALTRVNNSLTKAIKQLSDIDMNKTRKKLLKAQIDYTKAQTTRALINKDGEEDEGGTVINIIDDI